MSALVRLAANKDGYFCSAAGRTNVFTEKRRVLKQRRRARALAASKRDHVVLSIKHLLISRDAKRSSRSCHTEASEAFCAAMGWNKDQIVRPRPSSSWAGPATI